MSDADTPATMRDVRPITKVAQHTMGLDAVNVDDYKHILGNVNVG